MPYTRRVTYEFTVEGDTLEIVDSGHDDSGYTWLLIAEPKNHVWGVSEHHPGGRWQWNKTEGGSKGFDSLNNPSFANAILAYLNDNKPPAAVFNR